MPRLRCLLAQSSSSSSSRRRACCLWASAMRCASASASSLAWFASSNEAESRAFSRRKAASSASATPLSSRHALRVRCSCACKAASCAVSWSTLQRASASDAAQSLSSADTCAPRLSRLARAACAAASELRSADSAAFARTFSELTSSEHAAAAAACAALRAASSSSAHALASCAPRPGAGCGECCGVREGVCICERSGGGGARKGRAGERGSGGALGAGLRTGEEERCNAAVWRALAAVRLATLRRSSSRRRSNSLATPSPIALTHGKPGELCGAYLVAIFGLDLRRACRTATAASAQPVFMDTTVVCRYSANDGAQLTFSSTPGTGSDELPALVLIHGWSGSRRSWDLALPHLAAQSSHVYCLDLRWHGDSTQQSGGCTHLARLACDLEDFLKHIHLCCPVLVGASMGAAVGWCYVDLFSATRLGGLVCVDQAPFQNRADGWTLGSKGCYDAPTLAALQASLRRNMDAFADDNARCCLSVTLPANVLATLKAETLRCCPERLALLMADHTSRDWRALIRQLSLPTCSIYGTSSGCFPEEGCAASVTLCDLVADWGEGEERARMVSEMRMARRMEGCNHWCYLEQPEAFAGALIC